MKITNADKWCSRYARLKDAWESNGILVTKCVTCSKIKECKEVECGHYVSRRHNGTRYMETNTHPQCTYCNRWRHGEEELYGKYINQRYGEGTAMNLKAMSRQVSRVSEAAVSEFYKDKVNAMLTERGWTKLKWW